MVLILNKTGLINVKFTKFKKSINLETETTVHL